MKFKTTMTLLQPRAIIDNGTILTDYAIVFDETIIAVEPRVALLKKYPQATVDHAADHCVLLPGFINAHVHLEFSANKHSLRYGNFLPWLYSVMEHRDDLINRCTEAMIAKQLSLMLRGGTTTVGAISSYALDLQACADAKQNIVYFNELIGSQPQMVDALYEDFLSRLEAAQAVKRRGFQAGIAIHSPYSVHPILIRKAVEQAKAQNLNLSAHFLESPAERAWLEENSGEFAPFFETLLQQTTAQNTPESFLALLRTYPTLLTHATQLQTKHLEAIKASKHTIVHCPVSNRLLGNGCLDTQTLESHIIPWGIATDGLSSNTSLNLLDEMRHALYMHHDTPLEAFAISLIQAATVIPAQAMRLHKGRIASGYDADLILFKFDGEIDEQLALHLILHERMATAVYIGGENIAIQHD